MELVMVLRAKMVAQSFTVDWLSKAPWVSINTTATCRSRDQIQKVAATLHDEKLRVHIKSTVLPERKAAWGSLSIMDLMKIFHWHDVMGFIFWILTQVDMQHINKEQRYAGTSVPSLFTTGKTSLHSWMPVVSGSEPPLQENPDSGSSSEPSHSSSLCSLNFQYHSGSKWDSSVQLCVSQPSDWKLSYTRATAGIWLWAGKEELQPVYDLHHKKYWL